MFHFGQSENKISKEKLREKSRECHNHNAALPRPQEEDETDKSKQAQIEQTYEKY